MLHGKLRHSKRESRRFQAVHASDERILWHRWANTDKGLETTRRRAQQAVINFGAYLFGSHDATVASWQSEQTGA